MSGRTHRAGRRRAHHPKEHEMTSDLFNTTDRPSELAEIWLERDGAKLFAVENGGGTPVILLHGGLANHLACRRFAEPLSSQFRLITPDLRGSGRSVYAGTLTWDQLADDVAALVRHLGLSRAVVGGVSFGSGCAVRFALRHPALVDALVLLSPVYAGDDVGFTVAQRAAMDAMHAAGRRAPAEGIQALHPLFNALPDDLRDRARAVIDTFDPASVASLTAFMASGAQPLGSAADLAAITAPTLVVPGLDPQHPAEIAELYRRHLPHGTLRAANPMEAMSRSLLNFGDGRMISSWPSFVMQRWERVLVRA
jgi:3-oxoadipate enol-lactonase